MCVKKVRKNKGMLKMLIKNNNKRLTKECSMFQWILSVQQSVSLESYLGEVKLQLAEKKRNKPKHNLPRKERKALNDL